MGIFRTPSSTPGGDRHMRSLTFLYVIQCSTTFISRIFVYKAYFWQHRVLKWIHFLIFVHYNISVMAIFGTPSSTPGGDTHMRLLTFLYRIQCSTTFTWGIFAYNTYFWQHWTQKWIHFPIFVPYNFFNMAIFRAP